MIPFTRPTIAQEELQAVATVLKSGWLATGPNVTALEAELEAYIGGGVQVRLFNSATSGLEAALLAADIGPGDEVIVPAMSFVCTANVVLRVGAIPIFVDVDLHSRNLTADRVSAALSARSKAVMPVHLCGLAVDMDPILELAAKHGLLVLEDAAQAIGTRYKDRMIGSSGNPACFSFHPNKNMTTIEGGAVACSDAAMIKRMERIRFHGIERDDDGEITVSEWGGKMNLADVGAALGRAQLPKLEGFNRRRAELAQRYLERLPRHPALLLPATGAGHSWHMFCVCLDSAAFGMTRPQVIEFFRERGVGLGTHYPAIHLFPLYRRLGYQEGDLPNAERIGAETLTLPLFPGMSDEDLDQVCQVFAELLASEGK
jgi:dTDP-4-amino-4,6-dideoxygalactose transaminase